METTIIRPNGTVLVYWEDTPDIPDDILFGDDVDLVGEEK